MNQSAQGPTQWRQHFKNSLTGLPASASLEEVFAAGKLNESEYLNWAQEHFQKAILEPAFFKAQMNSQALAAEFWFKWKDAFNWTSTCLPVGEWEGHLLIACLEPTMDFPHELSAICVLASMEPLKTLWSHFSASTQQVKNRIPDFKSAMSHLVPADTVSKKTSVPDVVEPEIASTVEVAAMPEGLSPAAMTPTFTAVKEDSLIKAMASHAGESKTNPQVDVAALEDNQTEDSVVAPEGISLDVGLTPNAVPAFRFEKINTSAEPEEEISVIARLTNPSIEIGNLDSATLVEDFSKTKNGQTAINSAGPIIKTAIMKMPDTSTFPKSTEASNDVAPKIVGGSIIVIHDLKLSWFENLRLYNERIFDETTYELFETLKAFYDVSMILTLNSESNEAKTLLWDKKFPSDSIVRSYSLMNPSFLKIVKNTEKPYHGYPVMNEANERFIENWHRGDIPDHLTILPLIIEEKLVGMMYAAGPKSSYTTQALKFAQQKTNEWLQDLISRLANQAA